MTHHAYVIGSPIVHSISPSIHNAAFAALGIDARYEAIEVLPAQLADWVRSKRSEDTLGFNVTLPHKIAVREQLDAVEGDGDLAGAVNTVVAQTVDGATRLIGANTDTVGFRRLLADEGGVHLGGQDVLLLGAGGGARAVALDALQDGAAHLWIANRHVERAWTLLTDLASASGRTQTDALPLQDGRARNLLERASIVINATSVGLASDECPIELAGIRPGSLAVDLIYNPAETAFLREARQRGARVLGGLGMLVYQAAAAFERWTGTEAPVRVMRMAAEFALAERGRR